MKREPRTRRQRQESDERYRRIRGSAVRGDSIPWADAHGYTLRPLSRPEEPGLGDRSHFVGWQAAPEEASATLEWIGHCEKNDRLGVYGPSLVNCSHLYSIEQSDVKNTIGYLSNSLMDRVDDALRTVLGL